ncbi:MAG: hypothetical protein KY469_15360 [Actinobacteria bacterium]|nr:hypothetical protein [Actinomycetota bacterium]
MNLPERVVAITEALAVARVPHAFGGAIALAYCVADARATVDLDVNVFVAPSDAPRVLDALPPAVERDRESLQAIARDGQVRLWWEQTPVDLFFNTTRFHEQAALRTRRESFGPVELPVLACSDLAVFKAFFDRAKDWVDLQAMAAAGVLEVAGVAGTLAEYLGADDHRVARILGLSPRA